ncbi:MAG: flavin reductase family protein [Rhizobiales bacterium]|nr:flavin reductase family protein [Hyphomicrobiales bacterium]NRB14105.1 flavin reductase family protein [Hyphomicrobiales bacterium]
MLIDAKNASHDEMYKLLIGSVLPRPIAWVGSRDANGVDNLAPFSFFNVASTNPPVVSISISNKPSGEPKDSLKNILETKYFSVSIVSHDMREIMHKCGTAFEAEVDEFTELDIKKAECRHIDAPKVAAAKVSFECKFRHLHEFGAQSASHLILADILYIEVDDEIIDYPKIDMQKLDAVGRGSGPNYVTTRDSFSLIRK